jgi:hypothetical protein
MTRTDKAVLALALAALAIGLVFYPAAIIALLPTAISVLLIAAVSVALIRFGLRVRTAPLGKTNAHGNTMPGTAESEQCEKCDGRIRYRYRCCGQRLCADCYLDHVREDRPHEPPVPEQAMALAITSDPRDPHNLGSGKLMWLLDEYGPDRFREALRDIDEIEFTICQRCGSPLRRVFVCHDKALCTDCWLDHCGDIEKRRRAPS